jgi:hypothetical protein
LAKSKIYEGPHYVIFLLFHFYTVYVFSLATCSLIPSVCVLPLMSETKFHTHTNTTIINYYGHFWTFVFTNGKNLISLGISYNYTIDLIMFPLFPILLQSSWTKISVWK